MHDPASGFDPFGAVIEEYFDSGELRPVNRVTLIPGLPADIERKAADALVGNCVRQHHGDLDIRPQFVGA
jgi:hypothetical protein